MNRLLSVWCQDVDAARPDVVVYQHLLDVCGIRVGVIKCRQARPVDRWIQNAWCGAAVGNARSLRVSGTGNVIFVLGFGPMRDKVGVLLLVPPFNALNLTLKFGSS